jgi:hypothetical protein
MDELQLTSASFYPLQANALSMSSRKSMDFGTNANAPTTPSVSDVEDKITQFERELAVLNATTENLRQQNKSLHLEISRKNQEVGELRQTLTEHKRDTRLRHDELDPKPSSKGELELLRRRNEFYQREISDLRTQLKSVSSSSSSSSNIVGEKTGGSHPRKRKHAAVKSEIDGRKSNRDNSDKDKVAVSPLSLSTSSSLSLGGEDMGSATLPLWRKKALEDAIARPRQLEDRKQPHSILLVSLLSVGNAFPTMLLAESGRHAHSLSRDRDRDRDKTAQGEGGEDTPSSGGTGTPLTAQSPCLTQGGTSLGGKLPGSPQSLHQLLLSNEATPSLLLRHLHSLIIVQCSSSSNATMYMQCLIPILQGWASTSTLWSAPESSDWHLMLQLVRPACTTSSASTSTSTLTDVTVGQGYLAAFGACLSQWPLAAQMDLLNLPDELGTATATTAATAATAWKELAGWEATTEAGWMHVSPLLLVAYGQHCPSRTVLAALSKLPTATTLSLVVRLLAAALRNKHPASTVETVKVLTGYLWHWRNELSNHPHPHPHPHPHNWWQRGVQALAEWIMAQDVQLPLQTDESPLKGATSESTPALVHGTGAAPTTSTSVMAGGGGLMLIMQLSPECRLKLSHLMGIALMDRNPQLVQDCQSLLSVA